MAPTMPETILPFRDARGEGAIVVDARLSPQPQPAWLLPTHWGEDAQPVQSGGRGGAWFVRTPLGDGVLRHYLRGGWMARFSRDRYRWQGQEAVRSVAEFRLLLQLHALGLPVPRAQAAAYWRDGGSYRAAILLERLLDVQSLAERVIADAAAAPWQATGRLIARFHRAGLDHADLNAHNLLFDAAGEGWMIDFDKCRLRAPASGWQQANLARLRRSLRKLETPANATAIRAGFAQLQQAHAAAMQEQAA